MGIVSDNSIMVLGADDGEPQPLTGGASGPAFSPDGERIAYRDERARNGKLTYGETMRVAGELYVADADGSDLDRLTEMKDLNEASPAWSTDGRRLAYQRGVEVDNAEAMSIRQINPDGSCDRDLLSDDPRGAWYAAPSWLGGPKGPLECRD